MNILTDKEIEELFHCAGVSPRAIEAAVLRKLSAGVGVEPVAERRRIKYQWGECWDYRDDEKVLFTTPFNLVVVTPTIQLFTLDQLTTAVAAARVQAIQDCDNAVSELSYDASRGDCNDAIRALLGKEAK